MWLKAVDDSMSGSRTGEDAAETADEGSESGLGRILDDSGEFDVEATNEEARSVLADWRRDDFRTAEERMRRLTVFGIGAVLALFLAPAESSIADSVVTAALWTLIPATAVVGCLARTLRETESADDLLTGDAGAVYAVAVTALVVAGQAARRGPAGRALWRFLFRSAPFSPDPMPGVGHGDDEDASAVTWTRRVAAGAAIVVVADTAWVLARRFFRGGTGTDLVRAVRRSGELGGSISTAEGVALLVAALVAGVLVGLSLSVRG